MKFYRRHLFAARATPSCPYIQEYNFSSVIAEPHQLTIQQGQLEFGAGRHGGHNGGRITSSLACNLLQAYYDRSPAADPPPSAKRLCRHLIETVFRIDRLVRQKAASQSALAHMGTTLSCLLMDGDAPKIADFGLARAIQMKAVSNSWDVKGTWPYMAPEQFANFRKAGREADIYALGKILYEAISGKLDPKAVPFKYGFYG